MANSPAQEAKNAAKGVGDAAALAKRFGPNGDISIEQDPYGNYRLGQNQSGKTVRVYFVPAANGTDFSIATESQVIQLYKKNATQAGGLKALRKKLYELGFILKPDYTREDEASFNNAIIDAANSYSMEQVQKYTLNPGQKSYKFDSFSGWLGTKKSGLTSTSKAGTLTDLFVQSLSSAEVSKTIDDTILKTLGRKPTAEEKIQFTDIITEMSKKGQTTKQVTDAKGNTKTYRSSGYDPNVAANQIAEKVKTSSPKDYERQQGSSFFDWMQKAESQRGGR